MRSTRHGGIEHQYWKEKVAAKFRDRGYEVKEEYPIGNGKTVDIVAQKDGKRIAIEIETGKSDAVGNIRKCLRAGFRKVVSVATCSRARHIIERQAHNFGKKEPAVRVLSARDLLHREDFPLDFQ